MTLLTHPYRRLLAVVLTVAVVLDQGTKALIRGDMPLHSRVPVIPGVLDFVHAENPGAAWGLMRTAEHRMVIFTFITLAAFALLLGWHRRLKPNQPVLAVALSLLVGGAAGNFLDRLMYRSVTDFIEPYIGGPLGDALLRSGWPTRFPAFNIADTAITSGTALFLLHVLVIQPRQDAAAEAARESATTTTDERGGA
jgi:signal peptidase II